MPQIPIPKGTLHYEVHGPEAAPAVLVMPGAATAAWVYDEVRDDFLASGFRVIVPEYRGMGRSRNELWYVPPAVLAEDLLRLLEHLGNPRPHAACYSMGTLVLAELLQRDLGAVDRCAIGCMAAVRGRWEMPEWMASGMPVEAREAGQWGWIEDIKLPLMAMFFSKWFKETQPERYRMFMERQGAQSQEDSATAIRQFLGVFATDWNVYRNFDRLGPGRRLFLTGETDYMAHPRHAKQHPLLGKGPTVLFRESGHLFFMEQRRHYAPVVAHFFRTGQLPRPLPGDGMLVDFADYRPAPAEARA